jgi:hypothetical protein
MNHYHQVIGFVERLRKEAIGEPDWVPEKHTYEFTERSAKTVAILKLIRAAHGVSSMKVLRENGLFIDFGATIRCVNDCETEIYFLLEEYPRSSANVDRFVTAFFESTLDNYLDAETHVVDSKKIRSAMVRVLKSQHDENTRQMIDRIYKTFCGYVHANYAHVMEVYGGQKSFNLLGVPDAHQRLIRQEHIEMATNSLLHLSGFIASKLEMRSLFNEILSFERSRR